MSLDPSALNQTFGIPGQLDFRLLPSGLVAAEIDNAHARATVMLQGAQLTDWTPRGQTPVLWLSPAASFATGKAIRGGVPVCWPWFAAHDDDPSLPAHGHARTTVWEVVETGTAEDGSTCLALRLPQTEVGWAVWPHATALEIRLTVGETLAIELATRNLGQTPVVIGQALHAYFRVGDVRAIDIHGLDGCPYIDKTDGERRTQHGRLRIASETDRIYLDARDDCVIDDPVLGRRIRIGKRGSASTIVWNPWAERSQQLGDLGEEGYLGMVCVESANAAEDRVKLAPGAEHRLWTCYRVETA